MKSLARIILFPLIVIFLLISSSPTVLSQQLILEEKVAKDIINYSSGMNAFNHIKFISQFYRTGSNEGYEMAIEYVTAKAKEYGLQDVIVEKFPYDGEKEYFMWKTNLQWFPYEAELWMLEPEYKPITSYADNPLSLGGNSQTADVTGELIYIHNANSPESYTDKELEGKIILCSTPVSRFAIETAIKQKGALGFICYNTLPSFDYNRKSIDFPDQVGWTSLPQSEQPTFLFGLSYSDGLELKGKIESGQKIKVRANVKAEIKAGDIQVASAIIPGSEIPEEEIIFIAHLDHYKPGCNDNASGSAAILEIAHTLQRMIQEGRIKPPRRTIRFIWTTEYSGTIPWLAKHIDEDIKRIAVINLDMVGEKQYLTNSVLNITQTPYSLPSYLNDVLTNILQVTLNYNEIRHPPKDDYQIISSGGTKRRLLARMAPYIAGSDHDMFVDQTIGIPAVALVNWPDDFYHTHQDSLDKVDPTMLRRVIFIGAASAATLAWCESNDSLKLAALVASCSQIRLAREGEKALNMMSHCTKETFKNCYKETINILRQGSLREKETIDSVSQLTEGNELAQEFIETSKTKIEEQAITLQRGLADYYRILCRHYQLDLIRLSLTEKEKELSLMIPYRNPQARGSIPFDLLIQKVSNDPLFPQFMSALNTWISKQADSLRAYSLPAEMLNFADGKRSLLEIRNAVSAEYEPLEIEMIEAYFKLLEKAEVISFKSTQQNQQNIPPIL